MLYKDYEEQQQKDINLITNKIDEILNHQINKIEESSKNKKDLIFNLINKTEIYLNETKLSIIEENKLLQEYCLDLFEKEKNNMMDHYVDVDNIIDIKGLLMLKLDKNIRLFEYINDLMPEIISGTDCIFGQFIDISTCFTMNNQVQEELIDKERSQIGDINMENKGKKEMLDEDIEDNYKDNDVDNFDNKENNVENIEVS